MVKPVSRVPLLPAATPRVIASEPTSGSHEVHPKLFCHELRKLEPHVFVPSQAPLTPAVMLAHYSHLLTRLEEVEITCFPEIYFIRPNAPIDRSKNFVTPRKFKFHADEHIAYRYEMIKLLGKGSFGGVIKCLDHKHNRPVAIKLLRDGPKHRSHIAMENEFLELLQTHSSPSHHIVLLHETFSFRSYFCFVLELHSLNLYHALRESNFSGFPLPIVCMIARQGAEALRFCHSMNVIHGDVKPENIVFSDARQTSITLIDFGSSAYLGRTVFTYIQSRFYRAPEVVLGLPYDSKIDVWSLGCLLCEVASGRPLFEAEDEQELMRLFLKTLGMPPRWMVQSGRRSHRYFARPQMVGQQSSITEETGVRDQGFLSLVSGCLNWDPKVRLSAEQILAHPWVGKVFKNGVV
jgi:dual specificity tyrosine-phosphorylation-regulated kinase 2/3/4